MNSEMVKYYLKSKICIAASVLFFLVTYAFAILFTKLGMTGFLLLHTLARFNFYICFFLVCLSYYFISSANRNDVREVSDAAGKKAVYEKHALFLILVQTFVWNAGMCAILILCSYKNDGTSYFISWFFINYLCNILIPQFICIFLTFLVSAAVNTGYWLMPEALFLFFISPFVETIAWERKPQFPVDVLWEKIRWPFQILYQNGAWSPDFMNDFQIERVRIYLLIFWLLLLLCVGTAYIRKAKIVRVISGIMAAVFLVLSYQPASVYRINNRWDGLNKDMTDYAVHIDDNSYTAPDQMDFSVSDYNLKLSFQDQLCVEGDLEIKAAHKRQDFCLTLYHGYIVKEMYAGTEKTSLQFRQQGDNIFIHTDQKTAKLTVHIKYRGHHNKYYADSRAAMLPGWFPWYPMAGKRQVVLEYPEYGNMWGYQPYNRISKAHIRIRTNKNIITNLESRGNHLYEGSADSITVFGGNTEKTNDNMILNVLPLQLYSGYGVEEFIQKQKQDYAQALEKIKNIYNVDVSEFENKKVIFASKDIARNVTNNNLAVFDDYILAVPDYITADDFLHYVILRDYKNQDRRKQSEFMQMVLFSSFDEEPEEIVKGWEDELQFRIENPDYNENRMENAELIMEVMQKCDSEELVKEAVQYVLYPEKYENDKAFLERFKEKETL